MYLLIPRGTLTEEERRQIESHVSHSRNFLSQIPWTRDLKRIPEYAGSHHERLNGYGYPERRSAGSIPLQSRILMIADVYDALTASDRSYKKAMPAARAFEILREEAARGALDADLVEIFIRERVHISVDSTARCGRLRG